MKNWIGQIDEVEPTCDVFAGCCCVVSVVGVGAGAVSVVEGGAAWYPVLVVSLEAVFGSGGDTSDAAAAYPVEASALLYPAERRGAVRSHTDLTFKAISTIPTRIEIHPNICYYRKFLEPTGASSGSHTSSKSRHNCWRKFLTVTVVN